MNASEKQMHESRFRQLPYSAAATELLAREPRLFIDGEWVESTGDRTLAVIDPSNGREIGRIVDASPTRRRPRRRGGAHRVRRRPLDAACRRSCARG